MLGQGVLVTFEGGDGAGKSTLMKGLYHLLQERGEDPVQTRAPGGTQVGEKIRSLLLDQDTKLDERAELFLFLADRAQQMQQVILPALAEGKTVLCDRFNDSTLAYQGMARGMDLEMVRTLCEIASKGKTPDLTFYLDISPEEGLKRAFHSEGKKDRIESEAISFHEKIRQGFLEIARLEPKRVRILDAKNTPEILLKQAIEHLDDIFFSYRQ